MSMNPSSELLYPATFVQYEDYILVAIVDFTEGTTQGGNFREALENASDCLAECIAGRIRDNESIPIPSSLHHGQVMIAVRNKDDADQ